MVGKRLLIYKVKKNLSLKFLKILVSFIVALCSSGVMCNGHLIFGPVNRTLRSDSTFFYFSGSEEI